VSQIDNPHGSGKGRRKNPWDRFRPDDRRAPSSKSRRRLFFEPLERRDLLAIAEFAALPDTQYLAAPNAESLLTAPQSGAAATVAINYLRANASSFGLTTADLNNYEVTNNYTSAQGGITHVYLRQTYNGLPVVNAVANVSLMPGGRVLTASASFVPGLVNPPANPGPTPYISAQHALGVVANAHGLSSVSTVTTTVPATGRNMRTILRAPSVSSKDIIAELHYVPKATGGVQLAWRINVDMIGGDNWYDASVKAEFTSGTPVGQLLNVSDWVDGASYNVYPIPVESPIHGSRSIVTDPQDAVASPFGWHDTNGVTGPEFTVTRGNNVSAQDDTNADDAGGVQPSGGTGLNFDFPLDTTQAASTYLNAATVNLFYWNNIVHDITARHGFDEVSGNFQQTNYSNQGLGNDPVQADAQDGSGTNNANFATPPDGQSGRMQQYVFDITNPTRDSDISNDIIVHEFGHGVSNRLTGGPANANALNALQSGGMGEGWSDWLALVFTQTPGDQANDARGIGMWVLGEPVTGPGIRRFPYSFDMAINGQTLGDFNGGFPNNEVHNSGELWCSALWDMTWLLINRHGYDPNLYTGGGGNNLALDLVLLGMKLQPANPTFIEARDAILAADAALTGSDNFDEIWTAFARRGFGLSASAGANADSTVVIEAFDKPIPPVKLGGTVFNDVNGNGLRGPGEGPLAGWTVYVDINNNGVKDSNERSAVSGVDGTYTMNLFSTGSLTVREVVQPLWKQTFPGGDGAHRITVSGGTSLNNLHFGNQELPGEIHGRKWSDLDGDAVLDAGEPGIQGVVIYVDLNNDSKISISEPAAVTDSTGKYTILNLRPGSYTVREVYQPGFEQSYPNPAAPTLGAHSPVVVTTGAITANINFGNKAAFDYGDARGPYPTLISQNGAVHGLLQGFRLGAKVDAEPDGQPSVNADGDDFAGNETQRVAIGTTSTAGTFTLTFNGQTTAPIAFNANAAAVRGALEALTNVGVGQVLVTGGSGPGNPWIVTFQGTLAGKNLAPMTGSGSLLTPVGNVTVVTQQHGGSDDEDGIVLGNLVPGQTATISVTASTGSFAAGYLQGWIDFNRDGDWNDAGERIFLDKELTTGTVSLSFAVPAGASLGETYARFRYSLEHGIGPTGSALGGEVEDYRTNMLGIAPTAVNDAFTVDDNSFLFDPPNSLFVLANDLPSSTGPAGIDPSGLDTSSTQGTVEFNDNGTPADPTDDYYRYSPPAGFVGIDTFKYRDRDPAGHVSAPGTVTITVRFVPRDPIAVDNTFDVLVNSAASANKLDVIANDVIGTGGALRFLTQTPPTALNGTVSVDTNGTPANFTDDFYRYAPNAGFQGADSFTYTVVDALGKQSTGRANIQVLSAPATPYSGAIIEFRLQVLDKATNLPLPDGALIPLGTSILVRGVITDLRGSVIDPTSLQDFVGAFSGYMDLLYDRAKVQPFGPIVFGAQYPDDRSGFGGTPGLIDEIGAAHLVFTSPGATALVFTKEFLTTASGPLQFVANPADIAPDSDITAFVINTVTPANSKIQSIPISQVYYRPSFPNISILGAGEGDDTNLLIPTDVNLDGVVSPIDALLVVNYLNDNGLADPAASGEESSVPWKRDVNHDNQISPIDALMVINYLNRNIPVAPSGEAEGEADFAAPLSPLAIGVSGQNAGTSTDSASSEAEAPSDPVYASNVDLILGQTDWTRPSNYRGEDSFDSSPTTDSEEFFTSLGTPVRRNRKS
jgi:Fungalysin metallopeptidase (M36)/GEVED domain/Bacterial Ig domain/Dockerin type I domain/Fungalysin/Thermolysin Propeptide Motif/SdrD B-like domain